jgi:DNA repair protein RecO (recombination protein O)
MRSCQVTPAIVLRARPFGESDKIVSFLTRDFGKIFGIAKGALRSRKRFVNSLEPLALVNLRFQERLHSSLTFILTAELTFGYRQLVNSFESISHAAYLVEITDGLVGEREENSAVYQHLSESLRRLEAQGTSLRFLTSYELKLLSLVGYQPMLDQCQLCAKAPWTGATQAWHFSLIGGGILCDSCAACSRESQPLSVRAIEVLGALQAGPSDLPASYSLPSSVVSEIRAVAMALVQHHMSREIKSAVFLKSSFENQTI